MDTDRDVLRHAARARAEVVLLVPGLDAWAQGRLVDLRDAGPRPLLAVTRPEPLAGGRPPGVGSSVRLWGADDDGDFATDAVVESLGVAESRAAGPAPCVMLRLPFRLLATERRLRRDPSPPSLHLAFRPAGAAHATTWVERWSTPDGAPSARGAGRLVDAGRKALSVSLPESAASWLVGVQGELEAELPELGLRAVVGATVAVRHGSAGQRLVGLRLHGAGPATADEELREVLRRLGAWPRAV